MEKILKFTTAILLTLISSFAWCDEDKIEYPMVKDNGKWVTSSAWPKGKADLVSAQNYEFVDPATGQVTHKIRSFEYFGATATEVASLKETHEAFEKLLDQFEADRPKVWEATNVISKNSSPLITKHMADGFAIMTEIIDAPNLPEEAKAWFSDRAMSNVGRSFMSVLRQHGKDDIQTKITDDSKLGDRIFEIRDKLAQLKNLEVSFKQKLFARVKLNSQLYAIRLAIVFREITLDMKQKFEFKKDIAGSRTWGPIEDHSREKLTRSILDQFQTYMMESYNKIPWDNEISKFNYNSMNAIFERAHKVRLARNEAQIATAFAYSALALFMVIQPPIEYTSEVVRSSAMEAGLFVNLPIFGSYALTKLLTMTRSTLLKIEELYKVLMNPEDYGKPMKSTDLKKSKATKEPQGVRCGRVLL